MKRLLALAVCGLLAVPAPSPARPAPHVTTVVVGFRDTATAVERRAAAAAAGAAVTGRIPALGIERWVVEAAGVAGLRRGPVAWVEPDRTLRLFETPNDPLVAQQWAYEKLALAKAWRRATGTGSPVLVAVVDSGVEATHPDLQGRLVPGRDFLSQDDTPDDGHGHGTGVSGVIAANTDNREGIAGMSWGAKVMPLQTCSETGSCSMFSVAQAIVWAAAHDASVVNLSLGGAAPACPRALQAAATFAEARGSLLVAASGNSAAAGNPVMYPAGCDGFMAVGATDAADRWASFSDYGPHISVTAPGASVMTSWASKTSPAATRGYAIVDGTSFAAPHVSGLAALLFSQHPEWTPAEVRTRIEQTARDLGAHGHDPWFGHGRIDVVKAVSS